MHVGTHVRGPIVAYVLAFVYLFVVVVVAWLWLLFVVVFVVAAAAAAAAALLLLLLLLLLLVLLLPMMHFRQKLPVDFRKGQVALPGPAGRSHRAFWITRNTWTTLVPLGRTLSMKQQAVVHQGC